MYLTAQRVAKEGRQGINSYLYLHDRLVGALPLPELDPGSLERRLITIDPGDNRVLSYLDLVFPNGALPTLSSQLMGSRWVEHDGGVQRFYQTHHVTDVLEAETLYRQLVAIHASYSAYR